MKSRARFEGRAALDDADEARAQQRLAAGEADLLDAEAGDRSADEADDLVVREQVGLVQPAQALLGHAVRTSQVAPVGERDPQVGGDATERVDEHGCGPLSLSVRRLSTR
ncbi:hypothetical protein GCM10010317_091190 [Streptomyces mirabilis]|nr:hypothetical protein GCM10010317_091190 [Streptomyces mirabilis]